MTHNLKRNTWRGSPQKPTQMDNAFMTNLLAGVRRVREAATAAKPIPRQAPASDRQPETKFDRNNNQPARPAQSTEAKP